MVSGSEYDGQDERDNIKSAVILPNTGLPLRQDGVLETVSLYAIMADVPVVVQIWRPLSIQHPYEKYKLIHSISMTSILGRMQHTIRNQPLEVQKGDFLGLYFPESNPIPHMKRRCYSQKEQLRYAIVHEGSIDEESELLFAVAPLTTDPCRIYPVQVSIGRLLLSCISDYILEVQICHTNIVTTT